MALLALPGVAAPCATAMAQGDPLVGQLLVASPAMSEAIFAHTVILVVQLLLMGLFGYGAARLLLVISRLKRDQRNQA